MNYRNLKGIGFGVMVLLTLGACSRKPAGMTTTETIKSYPVTTLQPADVELQSVYPAVLKGQEDIDIKPRLEGFIDAVYIDEGSIVKKGQALFKINSPSSFRVWRMLRLLIIRPKSMLNAYALWQKKVSSAM